MSFTQIPNEAIDRMNELSAGGWRLYCYLARCRNQKTGKCCPSVPVTMEAIGMKRRHVYGLRKELADEGWATFEGDNVTELLGFTSAKICTPNAENRTKSAKNDTTKCKKTHSKVQKMTLAYKEEQYEGTILSEQYEIPVAVAPGSLSRQECYYLFVELRATVGQYEAPYQNQTADFVHLAKLFKNCERTNWTLTREKFTQAATHYFATPQKVHTLADLATRFSEFYKSAFDKFGKPVGGNGRDAPMSLLTPAAQKTVAALESWLKQGEESEGR